MATEALTATESAEEKISQLRELRSRHGAGAAPAVHIAVVEKLVADASSAICSGGESDG